MNRVEAMGVQIAYYGDPGDDSAFGEGPMQDALLRFRRSLAGTHSATCGDGRVLDVGCGRGEVVRGLVDKGVAVVGLDVAGRRLARLGSENFGGMFVQACGQELPFENSRFSLVCTFEVIEHMVAQDAPIFLQEITRVLVPGGILLLSTPNTDSIAARIRSKARRPGCPSRPDHFYEMGYRQLEGLITSAGLEITGLKGVGLLPGMWRVQRFFPWALLQDWNIEAAHRWPAIASETLVVATKPS